MGQQQLLLLVLGIVIVGLAVVVGIQAFGENQRKANSDALVNDGIRIASDAQAWALKPTAFGGGDGDFQSLDAAGTAQDMTLEDIGYQPVNGVYSNVNGNFAIEVTGPQDMTITGCSKTAFGTGADAAGDQQDSFNQVVVTISGFGAGDITTETGSAVEGCPGQA